MYDAPENKEVYISKQDLTTKEELPGAKLIVTDENGQTKDRGRFITEVSSSVNLVVLLELLCACIVLALAGGMVSVVAIMRYEPLQILANRD